MTSKPAQYQVSILGSTWTSAQLNQFMTPFIEDLFKYAGNRVLGGPFASMQIPSATFWDSWTSGVKLFGMYEPELFDAVNRAIERKPKTVFNIGCAEGYYAVGLARRLPYAFVHAYDIDINSVNLCNEWAEKNGVGERMKAVLADKGQLPVNPHTGPNLYVIDIEGGEISILKKNKWLDTCDIIVECHDEENLPISEIVAGRFSDTHDITKIMPRNNAPLFAIHCIWPIVTQNIVMLDTRPAGHCWLVMWAKDNGGMVARQTP